MKEPPDQIKRRLLFILHQAFVEARLLALAKKHEQLHDLADAMELIPGMMKDWNESRLGEIRELLKTYQTKHREWRFDYLSRLDDQEPFAF